MNKPAPLYTVGSIARELEVPVHRVAYVIATRDIQPSARVGQAWAYGTRQFEQIKRHVQAIEDRREQSTQSEVDCD